MPGALLSHELQPGHLGAPVRFSEVAPVPSRHERSRLHSLRVTLEQCEYIPEPTRVANGQIYGPAPADARVAIRHRHPELGEWIRVKPTQEGLDLAPGFATWAPAIKCWSSMSLESWH